MLFVFQTSVRTKIDVSNVASRFDFNPFVTRWDVDLTYTECILRVETDALMPTTLVQMVRQLGYECEELINYDSRGKQKKEKSASDPVLSRMRVALNKLTFILQVILSTEVSIANPVRRGG